MSIELITKMRIARPALDVFEAFADPEKIGKFWFSTSSTRWMAGEHVSLTYAEYGATVEIWVDEARPGERIVFRWGEGEAMRTVDMRFHPEAGGTLVEVRETGWIPGDDLTNQLVGNKEGWTYMLTCLKAFLENGVHTLRTGLQI